MWHLALMLGVKQWIPTAGSGAASPLSSSSQCSGGRRCTGGGGDAKISVNKAAFCSSGGHNGRLGAPATPRRGGELGGALLHPDSWKPNLHHDGVRSLPACWKLRPLEFPSGLCSASPLSMAYGSPSFFLQAWLLRRIFIDLDKGSMAAVVPSGMFPGDGGGTLADRSRRRCGEEQGLASFLHFSLGSFLQ
jgi:hypothetical protein